MSAVEIEKLYTLAGGQVADLARELFDFNFFLRENYKINEFLTDSNQSLAQRQEILAQASSDHSALFQQLTELLLKENLWRELPGLTEKFLLLVEQKNQVKFAQLRTAFPLDAAELEKIKALFGKNLILQVVLDPKLLGGFKLKFINGREINASLAGQLAHLKMELVK